MNRVFSNVALKWTDISHSLFGWVAAIGVFIADVFAGNSFIISLVMLVTVMDAVWGVSVSVTRGKFVLSELIRQTVGKLAVYGCALFATCGLDKYVQTTVGLELGLITAVVGVVIVIAETWSSIASMLILFPDFGILRLLQKVLIGEMARKLNIDEKEVEDVLAKKKKSKR